ncbi:MAG: hypothetical protein UR39_C0017G0005 [Candidatus Woesebacteria bacterium GW2011_GWA1_33_30]|uniref:Integral membrane protein n=1 Tax=Candidatus Woesebacteria bacterium GW2011_GWA2_33_28 TaxID=1618561 RepID=A0A0F9ZNS4_9BACT|nr:MAG: hypothetical protein UR38_C0015G0005 [Candidatus Woesebacteria bacterium GW2011_GWA2_33_28]KKP46339.1 MAG: hypothetical protein UR39_C0017G0005 [Candidatus Woesebacteria bacterium GW2011_GWA1_33_30]KKP47834.1 MAG: hypothetical protein UR40_C0017G0005 [Microgenomates group bacterium GW2011_GWC1_33_32]KKP51272.1 MAG: hypothetical protein UR44_C0014G0005 [Candidatus Woesebacteria bacterium GW2011_GWB1_33_38]
MNYLAQINIGNAFTGGGNLNLTDPANISKMVSAIIAGSLSIAGVILLFLLIGGGIAMIAGAGKSDPQSVEKGKKAATSALIGFVVVFSAYWIVKLIETITGLNLIGGTP